MIDVVSFFLSSWTNKNDFVLKKLIDITPPIRYRGEWSKKEFNYRKNTVLFKDSYHPFWE